MARTDETISKQSKCFPRPEGEAQREKNYLKKKKKKAHWELSMVLTWAYVCLPCMQGNLAHRSLDLSKCSSNPTDLVACLQPKGF